MRFSFFKQQDPMIAALKAWRDGIPLAKIDVPKRELGAFVARFWPSDLPPRAGYQMFVKRNERGGRSIVLDEVIKNAEAGRKWDRKSAERVRGDLMLVMILVVISMALVVAAIVLAVLPLLPPRPLL